MMMGTPVRTPWPISARWQVIVTKPSGSMATKTSGLSWVPCGMPSPPNFFSSAAKTLFTLATRIESRTHRCLEEIAARDVHASMV